MTALFAIPSAALGTTFSGTWLSPSLFEVTLLDPPTTYEHLSTGADYSVSCQPGAPIFLQLSAEASPSSSARCCASAPGAVGQAATTCPSPTEATGSFGQLPLGPYVTAATADDPDDGDALAGLLSAGDQLRLIFSAPTSMPLPLDASRLITVLLDGNPFDVGTWSGNWTSADVLTLTFAPQTSTNAAPLPLLADLSARLKIRCSAVSNITTPALPSGAPTSLACGQALPPGSQSPPPPVPIIGDFGAPVPTISVATSYDPDDRDAIFSVGDVIALIFPRPTDMGGHAANEVLSMENVSRLFQFSPDLPAGTLFAASWTDPATFNLTILNVTSTAPAVSLSPPTRVQCRCGAPNGPNRCRDSDGIHYTEAHLGGASELSCGTGFVDFRNGANWGLRPGPSLLSVVANDPDDADAVFADADTITLNFNEPTDAAGFSVGATIPKAELDQLFSFTPNLGRNYIGTWTTSSQIVITIVDASGHGVPAITYTTALRIRCGVTRPIRDLARRNLPSTCISPSPILGSFGELLPPPVATVLADDPDDGDGVLSSGDVITIRFGRATDRAGAGGSSTSCPVSVAETQSSLDALVSVRLAAAADAPSPPPPLSLSMTGTWIDCSTLALTIGVTPLLIPTSTANAGRTPPIDGPVRIGDGLELVLTGAGGTSGVGVRNPTSESLHVTGAFRINGSFGEAIGPVLISAIAHDDDDFDAILSYGDTLNLIFSEPTDRGGYARNTPLPPSWIDLALIGPPAPPAAWSGEWTDDRTLALTLSNVTSSAASALDVAGWSASHISNGSLIAHIGISRAANIRNVSQLSLPAHSTIQLSGDWGMLMGPGADAFEAAGGAATAAADAVYNAGDTLTITFNTSTDRGGKPPLGNLTANELRSTLECTVAPPAPFPTLPPTPAVNPAPMTLEAFGASLSATWISDTQLRITVDDATGAHASLTTPLYAGGGDGALIGRLSCCLLPSAYIRSAGSASLPSLACTPRLVGSWGNLPGPSPINITLSDPRQRGADLGAGDLITISFDQPTDRSGVPVGWAVPADALNLGVLWSRPLYSAAEGRWVSDRVLQIEILELHPSALKPDGTSFTRDELCPVDPLSMLYARILPAFAVRNADRTSRAAEGQVALPPDACAPGSGPGLYASGGGRALGLAPAQLIPTSGACAPLFTASIATVLRPIAMSSGITFSQLAAGEHFSLALTTDGVVYGWGDPEAVRGSNGTGHLRAVPTRLTLPDVNITSVVGGDVASAATTSRDIDRSRARPCAHPPGRRKSRRPRLRSARPPRRAVGRMGRARGAQWVACGAAGCVWRGAFDRRG